MTLDRSCTSTVGKLLFPQSEEGWTCCTPNVVQTLIFYRRLPGLNRHWIDLVHPLSENYFFHSQKKVIPVVHSTLYKHWYLTVDYQGWIDSGIRLCQLFPNIVPMLVNNSRSPTMVQHLIDRYNWQSAMISAWDGAWFYSQIVMLSYYLTRARISLSLSLWFARPYCYFTCHSSQYNKVLFYYRSAGR